MLSRFAPRAFTAAPAVRQNAVRSSVMAAQTMRTKRSVTTDAASSHVDKSEVPKVRDIVRSFARNICFEMGRAIGK